MSVIKHDFTNATRYRALCAVSGLLESALATLEHHGLKDGYPAYKDIEEGLRQVRHDAIAGRRDGPEVA